MRLSEGVGYAKGAMPYWLQAKTTHSRSFLSHLCHAEIQNELRYLKGLESIKWFYTNCRLSKPEIELVFASRLGMQLACLDIAH